ACTALLPEGGRDSATPPAGRGAVPPAEPPRGGVPRPGAFFPAAAPPRRYGLDQGFDTYDDNLWSEDEPPLFMIRERPAPRTADRVLAWLDGWKQRSRQPFFLWVHFFDPHQPYLLRSTDLAALAP